MTNIGSFTAFAVINTVMIKSLYIIFIIYITKSAHLFYYNGEHLKLKQSGIKCHGQERGKKYISLPVLGHKVLVGSFTTVLFCYIITVKLLLENQKTYCTVNFYGCNFQMTTHFPKHILQTDSETFLPGWLRRCTWESLDLDLIHYLQFFPGPSSSTSFSAQFPTSPFKCNQASDLFQKTKPRKQSSHVHRLLNYILERVEHVSLISIQT